jgi:hypothetical protein
MNNPVLLGDVSAAGAKPSNKRSIFLSHDFEYTGETSRDPTVKKMNEDEKAKVETHSPRPRALRQLVGFRA